MSDPLSNAGQTSPSDVSLLGARLSSALARITSQGDYIPQVDGLRFIAIGLVVLFHIRGFLAAKVDPASWAMPPDQDFFGQLALHGHFGVQLFFVLSGFLLGRPFAAARLAGSPPVRLGRYFARRLSWLEPPYLISLALMFGLLVFAKGESAGDLVPHLLAHTAYLHNLIFPNAAGVQFIAWSLEIEVQFYLSAPLLALAFVAPVTGRNSLLLGLAATAMALQWAIYGPAMPQVLTLANFAQFFLGGFLLAGLSVTRWTQPAPPRAAIAWDAVTMLGWPALLWVWRSETATFLLLPPLLTLLTAAALRGRFSRRLFSLTPIARIGGMCYSIYLIHYPLISLTGRLTSQFRITDSFAVNFLVQSAVIVPVVVVGSTLYFVLFERPFMVRHWPTRFWAVVQGCPLSVDPVTPADRNVERPKPAVLLE